MMVFCFNLLHSLLVFDMMSSCSDFCMLGVVREMALV
jgi:hypothetical protein